MNLVEAGKITLKEAAEKFGRSYRQAKRIWKRAQEKGGQGLLHGNGGRSPQNRIPDELKKRIVELSGQTYRAFNDRHFW
jgi:transposase